MRHTLIETIDDFDGNPGAETVTFSLDGVFYDIDLSEAHRSELHNLLRPYVEHGRRNTDLRQVTVTRLDRQGRRAN